MKGTYAQRRDVALEPKIPVATYRLQFNRDFGFADAARIIPYLAELGVSDIYASPYLKAVSGSGHGYDIVDHAVLNPELGSIEDYEAMQDTLRQRKMGQVLDIVPNHMCVESSENRWWQDLLENGPSSPYADYFDIDWNPVKQELTNKVLLPVLGDHYGKVLERGELKLVFRSGAFRVSYFDHSFPIIPKTYMRILRHRLQGLEEHLTAKDSDFIELLSIITALEHLPSYTERAPERISERHREKEIVKKRLAALYGKGGAIRAFIDENVRTFNGVPADAKSFDLLDDLLREQVYRLSFWRVATEEINYRRFFDINSLAAIRMEDPRVMEETHRLILQLIRWGHVTGLRVDHPDGLYDPSDYFRQLQRLCFIHQRLGHRRNVRRQVPDLAEDPEVTAVLDEQYAELMKASPQYKPFYIVGEKILIKGERMPDEWPIFSTTGYVFLNSVSGIFVQPQNSRRMSEIYTRFIREKTDFPALVYEKKKLIMQVAMSSEVNMLGHYLDRISETNRHTRDYTLNSLVHAITEVIAFFPVYRTYINASDVSDRDRQYIETAVAKAKRKNPATSERIFDFLRDVLLLRYPEDLPEPEKCQWLDFAMRFQQITGPVMAKGFEDTVCYIYNRLASLNEVGSMPDRFGTPLETFHGQNIERMKYWPSAMIATSTHDAKRSEDVRARINVLSEIPDEWRTRVFTWNRLTRRRKPVIDGRRIPDRNEEYLLYQTLLGIWPVHDGSEEARDGTKERVKQYMLKALREAKVNTSWISPNPQYEEAAMFFIDELFRTGERPFLEDFIPFAKSIAHCGYFNSLSQVLLKMTAPGVPDFYQGTDLFDFSLVDPDNRRPVDYEYRARLLERLRRQERQKGCRRLMHELLQRKEDGAVKLYVIAKTLRLRQDERELFRSGDYLPLEIQGPRKDHVCSFSRGNGGRRIIVAAGRFYFALTGGAADLPCGAEVWGETAVLVPFADEGRRFRDIFTGEEIAPEMRDGAQILSCAALFDTAPLALLEEVS